MDEEELYFIDRINEYRAGIGAPALKISRAICEASEWMARDMAEKDYLDHTDSQGRDPFERMADHGYAYSTWKGENIAYGYTSGESVFQGWKNSPGHDENMRRPQFIIMGLARVYGSGKWFWANNFGGYDDEGDGWINISVPAAGDLLMEDETVTVKWNSLNTYQKMIAELSDDGGLTWTAVASDLPYWGEFTWSVPAINSEDCIFRLTTNDGSISGGAGPFTIKPLDVTPPDKISDLAVVNPGVNTLNLTWTAPGDDGAAGTASGYEIRYLEGSPITGASWDGATVVSGIPAPSAGGSVESITVTGLEPESTYHFALKAWDDVPNTSPLSNSASGTTLPPPDLTPPGKVNDLAVSAVGPFSLLISWTAPGDDGETGTAASYDLRYLEGTPVTGTNWDSAIVCTGLPTPSPAGTFVTHIVGGFLPDTTYHFLIRTSDEVPNVSQFSNGGTGTTGSVPSPDTPTAPQGSLNGYVGEELIFTASASDPGGYMVNLTFSWDDGNEDELGPVEPGATVEGIHQWDATGTYEVRVRAQNEWGSVSEWSSPLTVTITDPPLYHSKVSNWDAPDSVITGEEVKLSVTFSNIGTSAWTSDIHSALFLLNDAPLEKAVVNGPVNVLPGDDWTVSVSFTAPLPGSHDYSVSMAFEGVPFGEVHEGVIVIEDGPRADGEPGGDDDGHDGGEGGELDQGGEGTEDDGEKGEGGELDQGGEGTEDDGEKGEGGELDQGGEGAEDDREAGSGGDDDDDTEPSSNSEGADNGSDRSFLMVAGAIVLVLVVVIVVFLLLLLRGNAQRRARYDFDHEDEEDIGDTPLRGPARPPF